MSRHLPVASVCLLAVFAGVVAAPPSEKRAAAPAEPKAADARLAGIESRLVDLRAAVGGLRPGNPRETWTIATDIPNVPALAAGLAPVLAAMNARVSHDAEKKSLTIEAPAERMPAIRSFVLKLDDLLAGGTQGVGFHVLTWTSASGMAETLQYLFGNAGATIVADERKRAVIVRGSAAVRAQVAMVISKLDRDPSGDIRGRVFRLKHARAPRISEVLSVLFDSAIDGRFAIDDPEANFLIVQATRAELDRIGQFIEVIDVKKPEATE